MEDVDIPSVHVLLKHNRSCYQNVCIKFNLQEL